VFKYHTMKTYWGNGGITPRILNLGTRWRWVVSFTLRPLYPRSKSLRYPLDGRLDGPQSRSGRGGEGNKSHQCPFRELNTGYLARNLVSVLSYFAPHACITDFNNSLPAGVGNFYLHHRVQNGSGSHPASYPMDTRALSLGVKRPGREADHSPPSSTDVKNAWSYTSIPPICLHGVLLS
jgi:hypothetical protein